MTALCVSQRRHSPVVLAIQAGGDSKLEEQWCFVVTSQPLPAGPAGVRRISGPLLDLAGLRSDDIYMGIPRSESGSQSRTKNYGNH